MLLKILKTSKSNRSLIYNRALMLLIYSATATVIFPKSGNAVYADPSFTMANKSWAAMQQCQPRSICQKISLRKSFLIKIIFSDRWQAADKQTNVQNLSTFSPPRHLSRINKASRKENNHGICDDTGCFRAPGMIKVEGLHKKVEWNKNVKCCLMWEKLLLLHFSRPQSFFRAVCQLPSN